MNKKFLVVAAAVAAGSTFGASSASAALSCPPGVTNPAYCTQVPDPQPQPQPQPEPKPAPPKEVVADSAEATGDALESKKVEKALAAGKTVTIKLTDSQPGTYKISAKAKGGKESLLGGSVTIKKEGTANLKVKLTPAGKKYLKAQKKAGKKSVTLSQTVSFKGADGKTVTKTTKVKFKL